MLKTGASGLIAYRLQTKDGQFQWLQTSSRLVYKNSKPDFIISTHRPLMQVLFRLGFIDSLSNYFNVNREEEGRDLLGKRTMDFKVSYLDAGLTSNYFSDESSSAITTTTTTISSTASATSGQTVLPSQPSTQPTTQKIGRKYKNQLRDFLTNCRTKRKSGNSASSATGGNTTPPEPSPYLSGSGVDVAASWTGGGSAAAAASSAASAAVAAAATAYSPSVYPAAAAAAAAAVPYHADNSFYHSMHHHHQLHHHQPNTLQNLQNLHQSFYAPALENRFGIPTAAEHNLFHHAHHGYRGLAGVGAAGYYAADYSPYVHAAAAATATNGFLAAGYDSTMGEFFSPSHVQFSEFFVFNGPVVSSSTTFSFFLTHVHTRKRTARTLSLQS